FLCFLSTLRLPPLSSLFPYTTLFRSLEELSHCGVPRSGSSPRGRIAVRWRRVLGTAVGGRDEHTRRWVRRPGRRCVRSPRTRCRSEEHTSELQSRFDLVCRLLLEKKT